jgi:hypothetical protein
MDDDLSVAFNLIAAEEPDSLVHTDNIDTPRKGVRRHNRVDYSAAKATYILGDRTLDDLGITHTREYTHKEIAAKYNINLTMLKVRSGKEQWQLQRSAYRLKTQETAEARALNMYIHESAQADVQAMIAIDTLNKLYKTLIQSKYADLTEAYDSGVDLDPADITLDAKELKDLVAIGRDLHTLSQQVTKSRADVVDTTLIRDLGRLKPQRKSTTATTDPDLQQRMSRLEGILRPALPPSTTT